MIVLVFGSLAYDQIMNFDGYCKDYILPDKIHNFNVSFMVDGVKASFGGKFVSAFTKNNPLWTFLE